MKQNKDVKELLKQDILSLQRDLVNHKEIISQLRKENEELRRMSLWSIRRLPKMYKEFAYNELDRITKTENERL